MQKISLIVIRYLQRFPRNFKHKPILSFYSFAIVARNIFGCFFCGTMRALCCQLWQLFGSQDTALNADQTNQAKHWGNDVDDDDNEENDDEDKDIHMFFYKSQIRSCLPWHYSNGLLTISIVDTRWIDLGRDRVVDVIAYDGGILPPTSYASMHYIGLGKH